MERLRSEDGEGAVQFPVRVAPRKHRDAVNGVRNGVLQVTVKASPLRGEANEAVIRLFAKTLRVPKGAVSIVRGRRVPSKVVRIEGLSVADLPW